MNRLFESPIVVIATNTYREAVRMKLYLLLVLVGLGSLGGGFFFKDFNFGASELSFIADFGFGGMTLMGSVIAIVVTVQLVYGEIEHRTIMPLLAKPVSRASFVVGKLLGAWLTISSFVLVVTGSLLLTLWVRETHLMGAFPEQFTEGRVVSYVSVLQFGVLQTARLAILASAAAFFSSYATSSLFAIIMGFFVWILGQLRAVATDRLAGMDQWILEGSVKLILSAVPDLRLFDTGATILVQEQLPLAVFGRLLLYAAAYAFLFSTFATLLLKRREL